MYFNNIGQEVSTPELSWESSNETVATIDNTGLLSALTIGETTITVTINNTDNSTQNQFIIRVVEDLNTTDPIIRTGTIMTTSSYLLQGTFSLAQIENTNNLLLSINEDYMASTSLPGLYLYLTNNPSSIANALNLGPVTIFEGEHSYTIQEAGINDYSYLLYWCEPFSVKVGDGEILD